MEDFRPRQQDIRRRQQRVRHAAAVLTLTSDRELNKVSDFSFAAIAHTAQTGDAAARGRMFASLYDELRNMAQRELRRRVALTLSPTTLLHETFLNISQRESAHFVDGRQFMAYAARAMRGLIVDHLRSRYARKRGSEFDIISLPTELPLAPDVDIQSIQIDKLNDALESLAKVDTRLAECVDLKFFCGFSFNEIAQLRDVSERTVQRDWDKARLLLNRFINDQ